MFKTTARVATVASGGTRRFKATASPTSGPNSGNSAYVSSMSSNATMGLLDGVIDIKNTKAMRELYRDMYYFDAVCGSICEMQASTPFSDWTLSGMSSDKRLESFVLTMENLRMKSLLPALSLEILVIGTAVSSLNYDANKKVFDNILPQNLDNLEMTATPIFGMDPIIDMKIPKEMADALKNKDKRFEVVVNSIPKQIRDQIKAGTIPLDPATTLYIARNHMATNFEGVSALNRAIPYYLLEKALWRGTLDQAGRRQRGILHAAVGDSDDWIATPEELATVADLIASADVDPVNAIIATRAGINVSEIKRGDDFWKISDINDFTVRGKLQALMSSESYLSGDVSINTMDTAMSIFVERMRDFRQFITQKVFYDKLFPAISVSNNYRRNKRMVSTGSGSEYYQKGGTKFIRDSAGNFLARCDEMNMGADFADVDDLTKYEMPRIEWRRQLQPIADQDYLAVLETMKNNGIPVNIRLLAAAGGIDLDNLLDQMPDDLKIRKKLSEHNKQIAAFSGGMDDGMGDSGGGAWASGSVKLPEQPPGVNMIQTGEPLRLQGLLNRDFSAYAESTEPTARRASGKRIHTSANGKRQIDEKMNKQILEVVKRRRENGETL